MLWRADPFFVVVLLKKMIRRTLELHLRAIFWSMTISHTTTKKGWNKNDQLGFEADKELTSGFKYLTTILLPSSGLTLHELCKKLRGEGEF